MPGKKKSHPSGYKSLIEQESEHWAKLSDLSEQRLNWLHSKTVERYVNARVTDNEDLVWFDWIVDKYIRDKIYGPGMNIGCNDGTFDRNIMRAGLCSEFDGYDISKKAIEEAERAAKKEGLRIRSHRADLNHVELIEDHYSLVITAMTLHHIERLEHLFEQVNKSLRPDGLFVINEYVGPNRFQVHESVVQAINRLIPLLPKRLRKRAEDGGVVEEFKPVLVEDLVAISPFEAVRSADIIPLLYRYFTIVERRDYGGTILHWLLNQIVPNFDEVGSEEDRCILSLLCGIEFLMTQPGAFQSDFTVIIASRK